VILDHRLLNLLNPFYTTHEIDFRQVHWVVSLFNRILLFWCKIFKFCLQAKLDYIGNKLLLDPKFFVTIGTPMGKAISYTFNNWQKQLNAFYTSAYTGIFIFLPVIKCMRSDIYFVTNRL
jgi:hypothetical protein